MTEHHNNIVSLSGGKDSTAMLLMMLERGESIHSAVFFDGGWEFPQMLEHIDRLEEYTGIKVTRLVADPTFDYWMYERPIVAKKGPMKGQVHRIGNGWPSGFRRWCTRQKVNAINRYNKTVENPVQCIGYADDEQKRVEKTTKACEPSGSCMCLYELDTKGRRVRFPLVEWGVTESAALEYCKARGFDWGGLYDHFHRVSCFCCPLQSLSELRKLRTHYPDLWAKMLDMDSKVPGHNKGFHHYSTVHGLDKRFAEEETQQRLL